MTNAPDLTMPAATAAAEPAATAALPRIKLSPHGFSIDHPDPALGEALMANALGVADREAMDGMLRQLVRARSPSVPMSHAPVRAKAPAQAGSRAGATRGAVRA